MIEQALEGRAGLWFETKNNLTNYEQFKESFMNEFYSIPIRVRFKNAWNDRQYNPQKESLQTYYYEQVKKARYFKPTLSEYEINYTIIQQYPLWIRQNLAVINYNDSTMIGQTLASLDQIAKERSQARDNKPYNNYNNNRSAAQAIRNITVQDTQYKRKNNGRRRHETYSPRNDYRNRYNQNNSQGNRSNYRGEFTLPDTRYLPPNANNSNNPAQNNCNLN